MLRKDYVIFFSPNLLLRRRHFRGGQCQIRLEAMSAPDIYIYISLVHEWGFKFADLILLQ